MAESKQLLALTSELSLAEAFVGAFKNNQPLVDLYDAMISPRDDLAVYVINRAILKTAAQLRSNQNIALADAIHVATALKPIKPIFLLLKINAYKHRQICQN